jgi:hypothetical protein
MYGEAMPRIKETNQSWKLVLSLLGLLIGGAGMLYGIHVMKEGGNLSVCIDLASLVTMFLTSLFAVISIRCPNCKLKWVWYAVSTKEVGEWLPWLISFQSCPCCEDIDDNFRPVPERSDLENESPNP